jgi:protein SCO1/2
MNAQMQRVQKKFAKNKDLKILSFTVMPEVDTVAQMKRYAKEHQAISGQWHFLTGDKKALYNLARTSFFVLKPAEAQNLGDAGSDFIHTNNFVLVDKELRIRGFYDGTSENDVSKLLMDIPLLLKEDISTN